MKTFKKILSGVVLLGAVAAVAGVQAQQGPMGGRCMGDGVSPGMTQCMGHGMGPNTNMSNMRQLMTDEERTAMHEKMSAAKTPEERQALRTANHAEMEKRAKEKGITLPERHQQMMSGRHCG